MIILKIMLGLIFMPFVIIGGILAFFGMLLVMIFASASSVYNIFAKTFKLDPITYDLWGANEPPILGWYMRKIGLI